MKALTIRQPWADLIASGEKQIENRTWQTDYRGPLAIHAGRTVNWHQCPDGYNPSAVGAVIAVVDLVDIVPVEQIYLSSFAEGPLCWVLKGVVRLPQPITCSGKQSLWELPEDIEREVRNAIGLPST